MDKDEELDDMMTMAAIVGDFVHFDNLPILFAARGRSLRSNDSGWQFRSGINAEPVESGKVWMIKEVLEVEPTLARFITSKPGTILSRKSLSDPWIVTLSADEDL